MTRLRGFLLLLLVYISLCVSGCSTADINWSGEERENGTEPAIASVDLEEIPEFSDSAYVVVNDNQPDFVESDYTTESFENYSELDELGRCGTATANIGKDLMPTQKRGQIGPVKPSGWHTVKYDCVDGKYLYNRCHLIGYQLSGENANEKNLVTGTRYLNVEGMLPFENKVADYVNETNHHVLYRVTPVFEGDNLVLSGVQMEGWSVEDEGKGICFNVFAYNSQPGVEIDYATGDSHLAGKESSAQGKEEADSAGKDVASDGGTEKNQNELSEEYIINTNTGKFHRPSCSSVADTKMKNRKSFSGERSEVIRQGYEPCQRCQP